MAFEFVPVHASEQQELIRFLTRTLQDDLNLTSYRPDVVHWKYFTKHPEWSAPRSLAVEQDGRIVAHGGVWPIQMLRAASEIRVIHLIDWAATRAAVGAGVFLLRKMASWADVMLTIGGSRDTRSLLPKLGYRQCGELRYYARVIRPWLLFRTTPQRNWKTPLKLLRNSIRTVALPVAPPAGWQAIQISNFSNELDKIGRRPAWISSVRTAAGLNHLLSCPAASFSGFLVTLDQRPCGYFVLARVDGQTRIADIRLNSDDPKSWVAVCALAANVASDDSSTCEIVAGASLPWIQDAWLTAGLIQRQSHPIWCYDPHNLIPVGLPLELNLADGDHCFLSDPRRPYLS
ncbi:MAG TPA: hypothetical protein VMX38_05680 [Verrucomicrobiae bacterium]|jgi:hypothetical protein|nr:hypothetical protein [Verrucomicrobiae bacterium]